MTLRTLLLAALLSSCLALAQDLGPQDTGAIRSVIGEQLAAFERDDAEHAFSLATPEIRAAFGTAASFMRMVRESYPVVYRPRTVQFDSPETLDGTVVQAVRMSDAEGRAWIALYPMKRQANGSWRIDGCVLRRLPGRET